MLRCDVMETAIEIEGGDEGWRGSDDVHNGQRRSVQYFWWKVRSKVKHLNCEHVIRDNLNIRDYYYCCSKWSERSALVGGVVSTRTCWQYLVDCSRWLTP